jgi:hypothetical protein
MARWWIGSPDPSLSDGPIKRSGAQAALVSGGYESQNNFHSRLKKLKLKVDGKERHFQKPDVARFPYFEEFGIFNIRSLWSCYSQILRKPNNSKVTETELCSSKKTTRNDNHDQLNITVGLMRGCRNYPVIANGNKIAMFGFGPLTICCQEVHL